MSTCDRLRYVFSRQNPRGIRLWGSISGGLLLAIVALLLLWFCGRLWTRIAHPGECASSLVGRCDCFEGRGNRLKEDADCFMLGCLIVFCCFVVVVVLIALYTIAVEIASALDWRRVMLALISVVTVHLVGRFVVRFPSLLCIEGVLNCSEISALTNVTESDYFVVGFISSFVLLICGFFLLALGGLIFAFGYAVYQEWSEAYVAYEESASRAPVQ